LTEVDAWVTAVLLGMAMLASWVAGWITVSQEPLQRLLKSMGN
jgi:hypothetical protein